jgi:ribA/ribD-fused uncharacterized protein
MGQWMMSMKALCSDDYESFVNIMTSDDPIYINKLANEIKNIDEENWNEQKYEIVILGNYLKFSQNHNLKNWLIKTRDVQLVQASPIDSIWGIGIGIQDAEQGKEWKGRNLLGKAIMEVRCKLCKKEI